MPELMWLIIVQQIVIVALAVLCAWFAWRVLRMLMWFNNAGRGLAEYELRKAELDVRMREAEANKARADAAVAQAAEKKSGARFGDRGLTSTPLGGGNSRA